MNVAKQYERELIRFALVREALAQRGVEWEHSEWTVHQRLVYLTEIDFGGFSGLMPFSDVSTSTPALLFSRPRLSDGHPQIRGQWRRSGRDTEQSPLCHAFHSRTGDFTRFLKKHQPGNPFRGATTERYKALAQLTRWVADSTAREFEAHYAAKGSFT